VQDRPSSVGWGDGHHCSNQSLACRGSHQPHCFLPREESCVSKRLCHSSVGWHQKLHGRDSLQDCPGSLHHCCSNKRMASSERCGDHESAHTPASSPNSPTTPGTMHGTATRHLTPPPLFVSLSTPTASAPVSSPPIINRSPQVSGSDGRPVCSTRTLGADFSAAAKDNDSAEEMEQDMWLASSLLNGHVSDAPQVATSCQSNWCSLTPSHGGSIRPDQQPMDTLSPV